MLYYVYVIVIYDCMSLRNIMYEDVAISVWISYVMLMGFLCVCAYTLVHVCMCVCVSCDDYN